MFVHWHEQDSLSLYIPTFHRMCSDHGIFQTQVELNIKVWVGMKWNMRCNTTIALSMKGTWELLWYVHLLFKANSWGREDSMTWNSGHCKKGTGRQGRGNLTLTALSIHTFSIARGVISLWGLPSEKQEPNFALKVEKEERNWESGTVICHSSPSYLGSWGIKITGGWEFKDSLRNIVRSLS